MRLRSISKRARTGCNGTKFLCWQGSPAWWSSQEQEGGGTAGESSLYLILDLTLDRAAAFLILRVRASLARWHTMSHRVHSILKFVIVNLGSVWGLGVWGPGGLVGWRCEEVEVLVFSTSLVMVTRWSGYPWAESLDTVFASPPSTSRVYQFLPKDQRPTETGWAWGHARLMLDNTGWVLA